MKGRLALDALDAHKLNDAVLAFERAAAELPKYAPVHAGLANAYLLQFEQTRFGNAPDRQLLTRAMEAARHATSVDLSLGEGWAVLGYLLNAAGKTAEAQAAARRATALEPENWRHHYGLPTPPGVKSVCARSIERWRSCRALRRCACCRQWCMSRAGRWIA